MKKQENFLLTSSTPGKLSPSSAACCGVLAKYTEAQFLLPNEVFLLDEEHNSLKDDQFTSLLDSLSSSGARRF